MLWPSISTPGTSSALSCSSPGSMARRWRSCPGTPVILAACRARQVSGLEAAVVADGHAGAAARRAAGAVAGYARRGAGWRAGRGAGAPAEADQPRGPVPVALERLKERQHLLVARPGPAR